jgi:hypothetical protein
LATELLTILSSSKVGIVVNQKTVAPRVAERPALIALKTCVARTVCLIFGPIRDRIDVAPYLYPAAVTSCDSRHCPEKRPDVCRQKDLRGWHVSVTNSSPTAIKSGRSLGGIRTYVSKLSAQINVGTYAWPHDIRVADRQLRAVHDATARER